MKSTAPWILGYAGEMIGSLQKDQSPQAAGGHLPFKRRTIPVSGGEDYDGPCDTAACRVGNSGDTVNCQQLSHSEVLPSNRSRKPSDYRILLGYNQLGSPTNSSRQMTVNKLILHENYNKFYHQGNDIALIQLHRAVAYSSSIFPACVPENTTKVFQARSCWMSGWGMLREDGEYTGQVKRVRGKRPWRPFLWFLNQNLGFWLKSKTPPFRSEVRAL